MSVDHDHAGSWKRPNNSKERNFCIWHGVITERDCSSQRSTAMSPNKLHIGEGQFSISLITEPIRQDQEVSSPGCAREETRPTSWLMSCARHCVGTENRPSTQVYLPHGGFPCLRLSESSNGLGTPRTSDGDGSGGFHPPPEHSVPRFGNRQATDLVAQTAGDISRWLGCPASTPNNPHSFQTEDDNLMNVTFKLRGGNN